jgi:hypothetical protein
MPVADLVEVGRLDLGLESDLVGMCLAVLAAILVCSHASIIHQYCYPCQQLLTSFVPRSQYETKIYTRGYGDKRDKKRELRLDLGAVRVSS